MELEPGASGAVERLLDDRDPLHSLLEHTTLFAAVTDDDDRVLYCNPALASLTGHSPQALIGKRWSELFGQSPVDEHFIRNLRCGRLCPTYEGTVRSGLHTRAVAWTNTLVGERDGRRIVASIGEDVTARRAAEIELRAAELERLRLHQAILAAEGAEQARLAEALHDDTIQVIAAALLNLAYDRRKLRGTSKSTSRIACRGA